MSLDFKNEDEVKEYMTNIGIEYRFGCYSEKNPKSCHLLADYFEAYTREQVKATELYRRTCDEMGHGKSCEKFARLAFMGSGCDRCANTAERYFTRACELGERRACHDAGVLILNRAAASNGQLDESPALDMLERACQEGMADACFQLSGLHMTRRVGAQRRATMQQAFHWAERACQLQCAPACANVSRMYRRGDGVEPDEQRATEYADKARQIVKDARSSVQVKFQQGIE